MTKSLTRRLLESGIQDEHQRAFDVSISLDGVKTTSLKISHAGTTESRMLFESGLEKAIEEYCQQNGAEVSGKTSHDGASVKGINA